MINKTRARILSVLTILSLMSSCYSYKSVKPTELHKLNHSFEVPVGSRTVSTTGTFQGKTTYGTSSETVYAKSNITMESPDGRVVGVEGKPKAIRITTKRQQKRFNAPFIIELDGEGSLTLKSGNLAPGLYRIDDITKAEVLMYDRNLTTIIVYTAAFLSMLPLLVLLAKE
jgi:hypothetical protein